MSGVVQISNNIFLLRDEPSKLGAFVEVYPGAGDTGYGPRTSPLRTPGLTDHIPWGLKDNQPNLMHRLATDNDVKWELINTRRDFLVGLGLRFGTVRKEGKQRIYEELATTHADYTAISDFTAALDESGYWIDTAGQVSYAGQHFTRITLDRDGKVLPFDVNDCFETRYRALQPNERRPTAFLLNAGYGTRHFRVDDSVTVPVYDPARPLAFPSSIYHAKHRLPGQPFYSFAAWWGTRSWTEVANKIPAYHMSGLTNGYNIKYLIKIPDDYFEKEGLETQEEKDAFRDAVLKQMKNSLAGESDRAVVTFYKQDLVGMKALPGVEIIPLKNTMTDDAYVQLYNTAKAAQASGHGILPALAGVDTGGRLGGSGKELEVAANFQQKFRTFADRQLLLRPLWIARRLNGWAADIQFWFEDIEVYNPDVTPTDAGANPNNTDNAN
ncbi:hypothetical protein [Arsenicibacter rosenii]|uniref:Phage portal protein n=1 Tax=Arsenicibacter rosenii TaxID=1750698 RepID=A0A1S2VRQ4_9BACT|nr:hypothetical protein [Arsenicibacter rosenii]OIN61170.1 hypothetical protein BLX24_03675 [Arsenicibacter rosenii]